MATVTKTVKDFDLEHIFDCGQCFRWTREEDGSYTGIAMGRVVNMKTRDTETGRQLTVSPCTEEEFLSIWTPYLDLDRDYSEIKQKLTEHDPIMKKAVAYGSGIRILKQDLWETILSFIISQNNNIPRIKGCIQRLAKKYGEKIDSAPDDGDYYSLPDAATLAALMPEDLAEVGLGYRDRYIIETAKAVVQGGLPQDGDALREFCGVGPKVANCIRLFGMADLSSFPIDVWVQRVMNRLYGIPEKDKKAMAGYAADNFGELGGIAQQYLFYYMRSVGDDAE